MKILDCTLRDGGHLNNWHFSEDFAKNLYLAAVNTGINYFEVGYKSSNMSTGLGNFAYCDDEFLNKTFPHSNCKITVMAQHNKFSINDFTDISANKTLVQAIRVASYPDTIYNAFLECVELKRKGYEVFFNLMAVSRFEKEHYQVLESLNNKNIIDYLVFSDSFGSMLPNEVASITKTLMSFGFERIGFHSHNNQQLAFANSLAAINSGCSIIDASICSLGRGAGNLSMELLLCYLRKIGLNYTPNFYFNFIEEYLPDKLDNVHNIIAGNFNIHPKYISEFIAKNGNSLVELYNFTEKFSNKCSIHYEENSLIN